MADQQTRVQITADAGQASREFDNFAGKVQSVSRQVVGNLGGVREAAMGLHGKILAIGGALVGSAFAQGVQNQIALMDATDEAAQSAGMSAEAYSQMAYAGRIAGAEADVLSKAFTKLNGDLVAAAAGDPALNKLFTKTLGIAVRDASGAIRGADDVMMDLAERFASFPDGPQKSALAIQLFGEKLGPGLIPFLNEGREGLAALREEADRLGLTISTEAAQAAARYSDTMNKLREASGAATRQFAQEMLPALANVSQALLSSAQSGSGFGGAMRAVASASAAALQAIVVTARGIWLVLETTGRWIGAIAAQAMAVARLDFAGAMAIGTAYQADNAAALADFKKFWRQVYAAPTEAAAAAPKAPQVDLRGLGAKPAAGGAKPAEQSRMAEWEADLAQRKAVLTRQGLAEDQYRELSRAEEARYWADLAARRDLNTTERIALAKKAAESELASVREVFDGKVRALQDEAAEYRSNYEARIQIEQRIQGMYQQGTKQFDDAQRRINDLRRQQARQEGELLQERQDAELSARLAEIDIAQQSTDTIFQLGIINQQQVLQAQAQFEQQRNALHLQALRDRLAAAEADPDRNPVELARLHRQLQELEQQHAARMGQLRGQQLQESAAGVNNSLRTMGSGWANLLQQLASGTLTISGFVRGVFKVAADAVVQTMAQMAANWVVQQIAMRLLGKVTALSAISTEAAKAGAGGVASMAAAPFPLNLAAPAFGASMAAAAMAFAPAVSAAGGFDIPANVNPIGQLHASEMVLPATLANTVRDMAQVYQQAQQSGAGQGGGQAGGPMFRTVPMPGDFWLVHRHDIAAAMGRANKDKLRR